MANEPGKSGSAPTPGGTPEPVRAQPGVSKPLLGAASLDGPFVGTDVDFDPLTGRLKLKGVAREYMVAYLQNPAAGCFSGVIRVGSSTVFAKASGGATLEDGGGDGGDDGGGDPPVVVDARC